MTSQDRAALIFTFTVIGITLPIVLHDIWRNR